MKSIFILILYTYVYSWSHRFVGTECEQLVGKEQVFVYVVRHNDSESALRFVMSRVPPLGSLSHYPTEIVSLCSNLPQCAGHLRDSILDELARYI